MAHMENEITVKQDGWQIETNEGTSYVPGDVYSVPLWLKAGAPLSRDMVGLLQTFYDDLEKGLRDYVAGSRIESIEVLAPCYFARLSAPGYLDSTEWCAFKTVREARDYLKDI